MMNRLTINSYCWLFLLLLNTVWLQAQTNLPINQTTTISTLTSNDFQVPVGIESLTVEVRGADGGHARLDGGTCDVRVRGGQGATMKATFAIGNGSNELRPGGLLRVFAGRAGQTDESGCAPIPVGRYGAGGGSSAILYQAPGETSTRWDLLAVAGGGGGGARTAAGITDRTGKGGQAVEDGGGTSGSAGGKNGSCGSSSDNGYGGAGINCLGSDEKGYRMVEAIFGGSNGFVVELKDNSFATETGGKTGIQPIGGDGFTGGAVGAGGGGGGGGFSGGAGSSTWQGGGGGSYIAPNFSSTEVERLAGNQGGATNFPSQGFVRLTANSNCPIGEVLLTSQQAVNDFATNFPNCTEITGDLTISGLDIVDVSPLSSITSVQGNVNFNNCIALPSLAGLSNLQTIGGELFIAFNDILTDLDGLSSLTSVGSSVRILGNFSLLNVNGLSNLATIGGNLEIGDNSSLTNLDGVCPVIAAGGITGDINIGNNGAPFSPADCICPAGEIQLNSQADVNNFPINYPNCTQIPGQLVISGPDITDLSPLANITSIEGYLIIGFNATLADLQGLSNLQSVGGNFTVGINPALPSLNGLTALNNVGGDLLVTNNGLLADFSGICPLISTGTIGGTQNFANNAAAFIASECLCPAGNISLNSQAEINNFPVNYPGCNQIFGDLNISGSDITDLSPLSSLVSIGGTLTVGLIPNLNNLQGLNNLQFVGGSLVLSELPAIQNLNALFNLNTVEGDLIVTNNGLLADFSGICPLISTGTIGGTQNFANNAAEFVTGECFCPAGDIELTSQAAVENFAATYPNCKNLPGNLTIRSLEVLDLSPLSQLETIAGNLEIIDVGSPAFALTNLVSIGGELRIVRLRFVPILDDLSKLKTIGGAFTFIDNAGDFGSDNVTLGGLNNLESIGGGFRIDESGMKSITGFEKLTRIGGRFDFRNNLNLEIINAFGQLSEIGGGFSISGNPLLSSFNALSNLRQSGDITISDTQLPDLQVLSGLEGAHVLLISDNPAMSSLRGLENLSSVEVIAIGRNNSLANIDALSNLTTIASTNPGSTGVFLSRNPLLTNLNGLSGLTGTVGDISIESHDALVDIDALSNLSTIIGSLDITLNPNLTQLDGLRGLRSVGGNIRIRTNTALSNFEGLCPLISEGTIGGTLTITNNAAEFDSAVDCACFADATPPVAQCKDIIVNLDANGQATVLPTDLDDGSFDDCGEVVVSFPNGVQQFDFGCDDVLTASIVIVEVTNAKGLSSTCFSEIGITEDIAPVVSCKDITVELNANGLGSYSADMLDDGVVDNCGLGQNSYPVIPVTCNEIGTFPVTYTVRDKAGNEGACTGNVTVIEKVAPVALCQDLEVTLDEAGQASIIPTDIDNGSSDNCGTLDLTADQTSFTAAQLGENTVTLTATDGNGNSSSCTSTVTVEAGVVLIAYVWDDQDGDGKQDNGEPGFSGAQVDLLESDGTLLASTTTDAAGLANFTQVPADRPVKLKFYTLPNLSFTLKDRGSNNNIDSDASRTNGMTATFQANKGSQSFESWDAGMWSTGTVQAYVWDDQDGDGKQDGGEPAIAGVRVDLLESDGAFIETAQTDASGIATFTGIPTNRPVKLQFFEKDDHRFTLKDRGSNDNIDSDASRTNGMTATFQPSMGNQTIQKWDAGLWSPGQVKAYVWDDQDGDGKQDAAEPAVEGVEVKLLESDGALLATGQTDASGIVTFTDVPADRPVKLQFFEKVDHRFTLKDQGSNNNIDSDASRTNGMTATFQASKGNQTTESWDAGLWSPGQVEAYVWDDRDGDGKQDAGEPGIKGVSVHLLESDGTLVQTGTTGAGGLVNFDNVAANRPFKLQFFTLPGFDFTLKDQGSNNNIDSDASRSNGMTATFQASTGNQTFRSWDAGLWSPGTVEAYVWDDLDGDGKQDEGEPAIANAKVDLLESDGTFMQTTTTNENGIATFGGVPADRAVKLQFFEPIDHRFTFKDKGSNDNIDSDASRSNGMTGTFQASQGGQVHTKMDCGLWSPGEVEAYVWNDLDGDGKQDEGEPGIEGVFVDLLESNNDLLVSTATDADGIATILDVPANRAVKLQFTAPAGYSITLKDKGSNDNIDSDASLSNGRTATFQATMGQQLFVKWDAGLVEEGTSGARVVQEQLETPTVPVALEEDLELEGAGLSLTAFPNPFSEQLTIEFYTSKAGPARIDVFNLQGQLVRNLYNGQLDAGQHQVQGWDGTGANAKSLPAGLYLIQMKTGEEIVNQKVLLQR
ncbi:MAG: T9SS type A sorting domain-containing protein [Saprospiraceae bacterium]|nr:T9SS type A sorting domain-containing protein [Saprospiraceae bacterium]